jgi:hypothetical protein
VSVAFCPIFVGGAWTALKLPDRCVLLAAQTPAAQAVATFDVQLAQAARDRDLRALGPEPS